MSRTRAVSVAALASALLLAGCTTPQEQESALEKINAEFTEAIEPAWQVDAPGIYGEPAILDGLVAVYVQDDEVGLRLAVYSADDGELLWDHAASPGGTWVAPGKSFGQASIFRPYPVPTIQPILLTREDGDDEQPVVVFFEPSNDDSILPDDILNVADARTGDELAVTLPEYDDDEDWLDYLHPRRDGTIGLLTYSPSWVCGDGPTVCFDEPKGGLIELDLGSLEGLTTEQVLPDDTGRSLSRYWGPDFVRDSRDGIAIVRLADGEVLWERTTRDVFGSEYVVPPPYVEFIEAGDLYLVQGYQGVGQNVDTGELSLDLAGARTLVALDRETGETAWTLHGGDSLCYAVAGFPRDPNAEVLPMCLVTAGSFVYLEESLIDFKEPEASLVGVNVADGSIEWEVQHAASRPIAQVSHLADTGFASRGEYAVAPKGFDELELGLIDLGSGEWAASPEEATFVCEAERADVHLEFEGSVFTGGNFLLYRGYPAGWYNFACDEAGEPSDAWSKGAVRVAGYDAGRGTKVIVTESGILAFALGAD